MIGVNICVRRLRIDDKKPPPEPVVVPVCVGLTFGVFVGVILGQFAPRQPVVMFVGAIVGEASQEIGSHPLPSEEPTHAAPVPQSAFVEHGFEHSPGPD